MRKEVEKIKRGGARNSARIGMTVKEYLQQAYEVQKKITRLEGRREQLRAQIYGLSSPAGKMDQDKIQTSGSGDAMERLVAKVDSLERGIIREINRLLDISSTIEAQIEKIHAANPQSQERMKSLLYERYILFRTWAQIATDLEVDERTVYKIHGRALQKMKEVLEGALRR